MGHAGELEAPRRRVSGGSTSSRRRYLYFCMAALWGYGVGILVMAVALSQGSAPVAFDSGVTLWVALGSLAGLVGGTVVAGAYRESRRRHS